MTWREAYLEFGRRFRAGDAYLEFGRGYWIDLAVRHASNVSAMSRAAGVQRHNVYRILRRFGVTLTERANPFARRGRWVE